MPSVSLPAIWNVFVCELPFVMLGMFSFVPTNSSSPFSLIVTMPVWKPFVEPVLLVNFALMLELMRVTSLMER